MYCTLLSLEHMRQRRILILLVLARMTPGDIAQLWQMRLSHLMTLT